MESRQRQRRRKLESGQRESARGEEKRSGKRDTETENPMECSFSALDAPNKIHFVICIIYVSQFRLFILTLWHRGRVIRRSIHAPCVLCGASWNIFSLSTRCIDGGARKSVDGGAWAGKKCDEGASIHGDNDAPVTGTRNFALVSSLPICPTSAPSISRHPSYLPIYRTYSIITLLKRFFGRAFFLFQL